MKLAVIIPIYNDDKMIENLLKKLSNFKEIDEIIISKAVDNFEKNEIYEKTYQDIKYKLLISKKGRSIQMNTAVKYTDCEILWFIHSDSEFLDYTVDKKIKDLIGKENIECGGLKIKFNPNSIMLSLIAYLSNLRAKLFKICFGDQSIFITKKLFNEINGFRDIPIMEDLQFFIDIKNHKKNSKYFKLLNDKIISSSRRFKQNGTLKTIFKMHRLKIMYFKGESLEKINEIYNNMKDR
ncbi:TIGR04283 family arsenosugar biosynthesis glycosyltransferase [Parvimonas sp. D9]|uniref:TIGR04283 family arsenosugar biosynthesis glycosyltransferase n=1 Tax=Parvimonas sp. D9 TaxID=3110689 RepID=UPI002B49FCC9|nr:TIGR04283 family arsenosugar biosynthesis glycosyltransferase [Parvimonas sp. D9]MEB3058501.1 TIGR04283 family arsenosugar biosynthesis glycosyltransferase [Parvimonas sp. D9]